MATSPLAVAVPAGFRENATAFGVTTGVMKQDDWERESGKRRPHYVLNDLRELLRNGAIQPR